MKVLIIQLSDIHFKTTDNPLLDKSSHIFQAVSNHTLDVNRVFLLISGDVAYSGKQEEYKIANDFICDLAIDLETYSSKPVDIICIPGNHDCDFSKENRVRQNIIHMIQSIGENAFDESVIETMTVPQKFYFEFADIFNKPDIAIHTSKLLNIYEYTVGDKKLIFNCINTSYMSQLHEKQGQMYIPLNVLGYDISSIKADIILTTFHHPLHWLSAENRREFKALVENVSDIYLTGHEHQSAKSLINDLEGNETIYVEGAVAQDSSNAINSGFNMLEIDLDKSEISINSYNWINNIYIGSKPRIVSYEHGLAKLNNPFLLSKDFKTILNDIGANVTHPNATQIELLDLYTYPRIEATYYEEDAKQDRIGGSEDSETVVDALSNNFKISLIGPENIGKSAILKIIFLKLHAKGFVPILIDGKRIESTAINDFKKLALDSFLRQYNTQNSEHFYQLSKNRTVLLIDDYDKVIVNKKYKGRLLSLLTKHYENIILTGNELMSLEEFLRADNNVDNSLYTDFKTYKIKEFGHLLRSKFINKWVTLGNQEFITDEVRIRKLDEAENIVRTVTGKNLVPNYPIFLITILQAIELGNPTNLAASTFGHYYEFLINKSFGSIIKSQHEITSYINYVSELAYFIFEKKTKYVSYTEFGNFDTTYRKKYTISSPLSQIIETLKKGKIIEEIDSTYEFKYLYIYYFFVSKYLADNITNKDTKITISALVKRVYQTEFANILLFLTHHTKDNFLLDNVLENAKQIFSELEVFKLDASGNSINKLVKKLPKMKYNVKTVDEYRDEVNTRKDEYEEHNYEGEDGSTKEHDINEDTTKLDIPAKLNLSIKMIEILGQILKNNYGKISNEKLYELVEETYMLGLRTLNLFFIIVERNMGGFIHIIQDILSKKNYKNSQKIEAAAKQILFSICSDVSYGFIKKVSDSLGTQSLETTYATVLHKNNFNSIKLIDFSIKVDHFKQFPNNEMRRLTNEFLKTPLATNIMRKMVIEYVYLFPTSIEQRQKILSSLDISMDAQRKIDFTSASKKKV